MTLKLTIQLSRIGAGKFIGQRFYASANGIGFEGDTENEAIGQLFLRLKQLNPSPYLLEVIEIIRDYLPEDDLREQAKKIIQEKGWQPVKPPDAWGFTPDVSASIIPILIHDKLHANKWFATYPGASLALEDAVIAALKEGWVPDETPSVQAVSIPVNHVNGTLAVTNLGHNADAPCPICNRVTRQNSNPTGVIKKTCLECGSIYRGGVWVHPKKELSK